MVPLTIHLGSAGCPLPALPDPAALPSELVQQLVAQALGGALLPPTAQEATRRVAAGYQAAVQRPTLAHCCL